MNKLYNYLYPQNLMNEKIIPLKEFPKSSKYVWMIILSFFNEKEILCYEKISIYFFNLIHTNYFWEFIQRFKRKNCLILHNLIPPEYSFPRIFKKINNALLKEKKLKMKGQKII